MLFDFACYREIDWPLIFGNFIGIFLHVVMAIFLLIEHFCGTPDAVAIIHRNSFQKSTKPKEDEIPKKNVETKPNSELSSVNKEEQDRVSNGPYYSVPPNEDENENISSNFDNGNNGNENNNDKNQCQDQVEPESKVTENKKSKKNQSGYYEKDDVDKKDDTWI